MNLLSGARLKLRFRHLLDGHQWQWKRNIYGDEINMANARSVWVCDCGAFQWRRELHYPAREDR